MDSAATLLSLIVFLPALAALPLVLLIPREKTDAIRLYALATTVVVFLLTILLIIPGQGMFEVGLARMQSTFSFAWMPTFNIYYFMGVDGISLPLVILTSFLSMISMWASWPITKHVKAYCVLFLLLETGILGVFLALDFFLFYVFWELMLLPMYFLIGVWGGPRREYAAIKFFLYTFLGGVLMLIALLMLYFNSDLKELAIQSDLLESNDSALVWNDLHLDPQVTAKVEASFAADTIAANGAAAVVQFRALSPQSSDGLQVVFEDDPQITAGNETVRLDESDPDAPRLVFQIDAGQTTAAQIVNLASARRSDTEVTPLVSAALVGDGDGSGLIDVSDTVAFQRGMPIHTFNLLALAKMGQMTTLFNNPDDPILFGKSIQWWAFLLLLIGFLIKVPAVPFHTWLPDAHVEAPTPISMMLAGILLKLGGYGILRICYPICPEAGYDLAWFVVTIGVVSMVYGAFAALAQKDFKRLVAYSSVSHMGYVVVGLGVWSAWAGTQFNAEYWQLGVNGAMFQMIGHGISSAGMFFMVGVIYERVHHRNLNEFGGLFAKMPIYSGLAFGIFFAALGLPGLCGFIGEFWVTLSVWNYSHVLAIIGASVVILTAGYILWTLQRVYLGPQYKGPHADELRPITARELGIAVPLLALAIVLGVYPRVVFDYMTPSVDQAVQELADWTRTVKEPQLIRAAAASEEAAADATAATTNRQVHLGLTAHEDVVIEDAVNEDAGVEDVAIEDAVNEKAVSRERSIEVRAIETPGIEVPGIEGRASDSDVPGIEIPGIAGPAIDTPTTNGSD
jgi:NADH-quinone oxidoreductase subunit M